MIKGILIGTAIGDAFGAGVEFQDRDWIQQTTQTHTALLFFARYTWVPSDSKYTTGAVLYILKNAKNAFDALKKSVLLGGDVDSLAAITTAIMAGRFGLKEIPNFMLKNIENKAYLENIAAQFKLKIQK